MNGSCTYFRNCGSGIRGHGPVGPKALHADGHCYQDLSGVTVEHAALGRRWFYGEGVVPVLVTGNETNTERVFKTPNEEPYVKDAIDRFVVHGDTAAVNPNGIGTKAALHYKVVVPAQGTTTLRFRLTNTDLGERRSGPGGDRPVR